MHIPTVFKALFGSAIMLAASSWAVAAPYSPRAMTASAPEPARIAYFNEKSPEQKLQEVLRTHIWLGDRISDAMRAATGDPNISVIDRRYHYGDVYTCHYSFWGPQRVLICD